MIALALVAGLATPGPTVGGGFITGQRAQPGWAGKVRVNGATAFARHAWGSWSLRAGWAGQHEAVTVDPVLADPMADPDDPPPDPGPTLAKGGPAWDQQAGALAGYAHPWFAVAVGAGWRRTIERRAAQATTDDVVHPAGRVRLGPTWLHADAVYLDPTPDAPGPGHARFGVGSHLKGGQVWVGAAWRAEHALAVAAAGRVPLDGGLFLTVGAALDPADPARWLELQGGLGFTFGVDAPAPASKPTKTKHPTPRPPIGLPPATPSPQQDPMGDPL